MLAAGDAGGGEYGGVASSSDDSRTDELDDGGARLRRRTDGGGAMCSRSSPASRTCRECASTCSGSSSTAAGVCGWEASAACTPTPGLAGMSRSLYTGGADACTATATGARWKTVRSCESRRRGLGAREDRPRRGASSSSSTPGPVETVRRESDLASKNVAVAA
jgi:hypothetical protein